jgi:hypothetical protein
MTAMRGIAAKVIARTALAAALLACSAGCANTLMPTPVGLDRAGADPFTQTPPELRSTEVPVFIASNRGVEEQVPANSPSRFNDKRSQHMHLGVMTVDVGAASVVIRDTGVGIAPGQVDAMYQPFVRGDAGRRGGHGVGLTIVRRLSDRYGWPVTIDSSPGVGTRVEIRFPEARSEPLVT